MKIFTTLSVIFLFVLVLVLYFRTAPESLPPADKNPAVDAAPLEAQELLPPSEGSVTWLQIQTPQKNQTVTLSKENDRWMIRHPIYAKADPKLVEGCVRYLQTIKKNMEMPPAAGWEEYGLAAPSLKLGVGNQEEKKRRYLLLGDDSPVANGIFARWEEGGTYFLLPGDIAKHCEHSVYTYRDKRVFDFFEKDVLGVEFLIQGETYIIGKQSGAWVWSMPGKLQQSPLSGKTAKMLIEKLQNFFIKEFMEDSRQEQEQIAATDHFIEIKMSNNQTQKLYLGDEVPLRNGFYGRLEGQETVLLLDRDKVLAIFELLFSLKTSAGQSLAKNP